MSVFLWWTVAGEIGWHFHNQRVDIMAQELNKGKSLLGKQIPAVIKENFSWPLNQDDSTKELVLGEYTQKIGFIIGVDNVNWPLYRDS